MSSESSIICTLVPVAAVVAIPILVWYVRKLFSVSANDPAVIHHPFDLSSKSRILPGPDRIRVSRFAENDHEYLTYFNPNIKTLYDNFLHGLRTSNNGDCLGIRDKNGEYKYLTYKEVLDKAQQFGSGLLEIGLKEGSKTYLGIYSQNRLEWDIASLGCICYSMVIVPLYDSLGADSMSFIVNQTQLEVILCDTWTKAEAILQSSSQLPSLKHVVVMDEWKDKENQMKYKTNIKIHSFQDFLTNGKRNSKPLHLPNTDDLYMICYTSGTTGTPKGVMISHKNMMAQISWTRLIFKTYNIEMTPTDDVVISYLPMAHTFEQYCRHGCAYTYGVKVGYFQGDLTKLLDDFKALKPTSLPVVPRLLNRLYDKIQLNLSSGGFKKWLFNFALKRKLAEMQRGIVRRTSFWDKLVFGKIQRELGGRVTRMAIGSAPIAADVLTFCRVVTGAHILEGYGLTETTAAVTATFPGEVHGGDVGAPLPIAQFKLIDVPELEYFSKDDQGEICIRGSSVTTGYFREPQLTKEAIDEDGWFHTGDIGMWLPDGSLKIVDRKKNIFKLAQGEYVAPEKIESVYLRCPLVAQIFVDGNSLQRYLVAIVVPEETELKKWAKDNGLDNLGYDEICKRDDFEAVILKQMHETGVHYKLNSLEQVRAIHFTSEPFSLENGLLTPTMKSKRAVLRKRYSAVVEQLYKQLAHHSSS